MTKNPVRKRQPLNIFSRLICLLSIHILRTQSKNNYIYDHSFYAISSVALFFPFNICQFKKNKVPYLFNKTLHGFTFEWIICFFCVVSLLFYVLGFYWGGLLLNKN